MNKKSKNNTKEHKQVKYKKDIFVDEGILPIVIWLNNFKSIETEFSCEGDDKINKRSGSLPYVLFTCKKVKDLNKITKDLCSFNEHEGRNRYDHVTELNIFEANECVEYTRFTLHFYNKKQMKNFGNFLKAKEGKND